MEKKSRKDRVLIVSPNPPHQQKIRPANRRTDFKKVEARVGIEPTIEDLQSSALPLGDRA